MKNVVSTADLKRIEANLSFVIRGIDSHFSNDQLDREMVIDSLMCIDFNLSDMIKAAEAES